MDGGDNSTKEESAEGRRMIKKPSEKVCRMRGIHTVRMKARGKQSRHNGRET
jgi:hypothetical protein